MIAIAIESEGHARDMLIVILDAQNVERAKAADPGEIVLGQFREKLLNPTVLICYEDESPDLARLINRGDPTKLLAFLRRGFTFRPDSGDHDRGLERLDKTNQGDTAC